MVVILSSCRKEREILIGEEISGLSIPESVRILDFSNFESGHEGTVFISFDISSSSNFWEGKISDYQQLPIKNFNTITQFKDLNIGANSEGYYKIIDDDYRTSEITIIIIDIKSSKLMIYYSE